MRGVGTRMRKPFSTEVTLKGFVSSMDSDMLLSKNKINFAVKNKEIIAILRQKTKVQNLPSSGA